MKIDNSFLFDFARTLYSDFSYNNKDGKIFPPLRYLLEITYRCNLTCPFCHLGEKRKLNELNTNEWISIIKQIPSYAFISILGGEIFIRDDIFELIEYASKRVSGKVTLFSNGTLLNKEKLDKLLKIKLLLFSVSIDGIGSKHDQLRCREGAFDKTLESLLYVRNNKKSPLTEVKTVVLSENLEELPQIYKLANNNKIDFMTFSFLRTTNIRQNPTLLDEMPKNFLEKEYPIEKYFNFEIFEEVYKELEALSKNAHTLIRWAPKFKPHSPVSTIKHLFDNGEKNIKELYKPCKFPFSDIFINPEGDIYPCLPIKMGNLKEKDLSKIINDSKFREFRKLLKKEKVFTPCNLCCDIYPLPPQ